MEKTWYKFEQQPDAIVSLNTGKPNGLQITNPDKTPPDESLVEKKRVDDEVSGQEDGLSSSETYSNYLHAKPTYPTNSRIISKEDWVGKWLHDRQHMSIVCKSDMRIQNCNFSFNTSLPTSQMKVQAFCRRLVLRGC